MEARRGEANGVRRTKGRRAYNSRRKALGLRGARRGEDDGEDKEEHRGSSAHWHIIGWSVLLISGLSLVNFLALPSEPHHRAAPPVLAKPGLRGAISQPLTLAPQASPNDHRRARVLDDVLGRARSALGGKPAQDGHPGAGPDRALGAAARAEPTVQPNPKKSVVLDVQVKEEGAAAAALGGMLLFEGDSYLQVSVGGGCDFEEVTFGAWIFVPNVPQTYFPAASASMKTIAATKTSGCAVGQDTSGWALFVHEWGTTNRQLRLSWTTGTSACNELYSLRDLIQYDKWTLVGFTLSQAQNAARLYIDNKLVADTAEKVGEFSIAGKALDLATAAVAGRSVKPKGGKMILGAHVPQAKDKNHQQSHTFMGFIADIRILSVIHQAPGETVQALTSPDLGKDRDNLALLVQPKAGEVAKNSVSGAPFEVQSTEGAGSGNANKAVKFDVKAKHPLLVVEEVGSTGQPGTTLDDAALQATFPKAWTDSFSVQELLASQRQADAWADEVRDAMRHTWNGYRRKAFGHDDVKPISGNAKNWCKLAITMLDALSTLWVMGLKAEFDEAHDWLQANPLPAAGKHGLNSLFEINIRAIGGLLSAYSLSNRPLFLETAVRIADVMLPAFKTASGMPNAVVDVGTGESGHHSWQKNAVLAEVATVQIEFRYLSHVTGNSAYKEAADKALNTVLQAAGSRGIVPIYLSLKSAKPTFVGNKISFGAMGDSYYEYLLKQWVQTGKTEDRFKDAWKLSMKEMISQLVMKTKGGLTYIAEKSNNKVAHRMDHLACFVAGMLMLGTETLPANEVDPQWKQIAAEVTETCYQMYKRSPSGLSPEYVTFKTELASGKDMAIPADAPHNLLRPEAAEAIYYMHYYTGDPKYRLWSHEMFAAFNKHCRVRYGYSAVGDVRKVPPNLKDSQESFWAAETLKYFYLTFAPRSTLSLEEFVLNTEAHPLRLWAG